METSGTADGRDSCSEVVVRLGVGSIISDDIKVVTVSCAQWLHWKIGLL